MKTVFHHAALPLIATLAAMPAPALAGDRPAFELTLDIDQDGTMDRAVVVQDDGPADLYIYLATAGEKLDPSRKPDFVRKALTEDRILDLESKGKGSLAITSCFGCGASKSTEDTLTIVHRQGKFLVGGYSRYWDWGIQKSDGTVETTIGDCDINYLTGKATASRDLEAGKPVKGRFKPVPLKNWSYEKRPKICSF
ncbi:hypothetical protein EJ070_34635 [Mesorhizobium sp. M1E.F.Ca.ET.045.02.1.1]|uniref:hypothetical protein n=1 Tax=unclassified Mesorhizobium TaxID=325217 RepID=UPI000F74EF84|nr:MULTISPECIES: hypothetical protein [unclassified Mesorhizobium]AZO25289.1 hypothetical protein EJ070_34635 [Mesorhizobium sp. M1E.F.Ca.ET.045.02.1.1]RUW83213.1 hypothetical protein EOA29_14395 [Mesorhizobium sp. M1E.F.Ca.ET.063.01.1.1]TKB16608.1 MAG: hypothetical protein E5V75_13770 [Mesorhizobium sp.]